LSGSKVEHRANNDLCPRCAARAARSTDRIGLEHSASELLETLIDRLAEAVGARLTTPEPPSSGWMTSKEAQAYSGIDPKRLSELQQSGKLACGKDGRKLLFKKEHLDRYLEGDQGY
jgi:hypothetical protein